MVPVVIWDWAPAKTDVKQISPTTSTANLEQEILALFFIEFFPLSTSIPNTSLFNRFHGPHQRLCQPRSECVLKGFRSEWALIVLEGENSGTTLVRNNAER
jgi:hypothetical protein